MTQPDPAVEAAARALADSRVTEQAPRRTDGSYWDEPPVPAGAVEQWRESFRAEVRVVLAALRDAGWRNADSVQFNRDRIAAAIEQIRSAERLAEHYRVELAGEREAHALLFEQRDEAITERDRLRIELERAHHALGVTELARLELAAEVERLRAELAKARRIVEAIDAAALYDPDTVPTVRLAEQVAELVAERDRLRQQLAATKEALIEALKAKRRSYEQAITHLRDDEAFVTWMAAQPDGTLYDNDNQLAADYLSARLTEGAME